MRETIRYGTYYLRNYGEVSEINFDYLRLVANRNNADGVMVLPNDEDGSTADVFLVFYRKPSAYDMVAVLSDDLNMLSLPYVGFEVNEKRRLAVEIDDIILYDAKKDTFYHLQPTLTGLDGEFFVAVEWK